MKISLTVTIDDTQKVFESSAQLDTNGGPPDAMTVQWMLYGMLTDATMKLKVQPAPKPEPTSGEPVVKGEA